MNMKIYNSAYTNQHYNRPKFNNGISPISFRGTTEVYAFTDIHQNANKHCRFINELMEESQHKDNIVVLDNGDLFKGLYPKDSLINTCARAKKLCPNLEMVCNVGNNDPGYRPMDRQYFREYLKIMNESGINVISANIIDEKTGKIPEGIKPYAIVNRDGDNLLYVGFVVDKVKQLFAGMASCDPVEALEKIAPELKKQMRENDCKGMVMLIHDEENNAFKLKDKAKELGLDPEFIIGGHVHHSYVNDKERIYYPEPFGLSMTHFTLDINDKKHSISNIERILPENCSLGIFDEEIKKVEKAEAYDEQIAKSVIELDYKYKPEDRMELTELGTFYADALMNITDSEIGLVSKPWIYDTLPKKENGYITKMDILKSFSQPYSNIVQIEVTPDELRNLYQRDISEKSRLFESSQNVSIGLDSDGVVKQIKIDDKELFNEDGSPKEPDRKIKVALDYFAVYKKGYNEKESTYSMYDAIANQLTVIEKTYSDTDRYPVATKYEVE